MFRHLQDLTDRRGLFEHAEFEVPRVEHGYCLDDVARALVVLSRERSQRRDLQELFRLYLDYTVAAVTADGRCHNRMDTSGRWTDEPGLGDWWGRAVWGLGVAANQAPSEGMRARAQMAFRVLATNRSPHLRAMAYAALGAAEMVLHHPAHVAARSLLVDTLAAFRQLVQTEGSWMWPQTRMTYGNGTLVEALLAAGDTLPDAQACADGLRLLDFLLSVQTIDGHLSVTAAGGRGPDDSASPTFDQQPIEVAALADACARAYRMTGDPRWRTGVSMAWAWFCGDNDRGICMFDPQTGAGFDGLTRDGRNLNRGAESTLAAVSTYQHAQRLAELG